MRTPVKSIVLTAVKVTKRLVVVAKNQAEILQRNGLSDEHYLIKWRKGIERSESDIRFARKCLKQKENYLKNIKFDGKSLQKAVE
uniref:Uncharacterized protein n=1 Tax=Ditylenchus dipsaci TaxID=166011 RepID=A0A915D9F5_9BILA